MRHLPLGQLSAVSGLCAAAPMAAGRRLIADPPRFSQPPHSGMLTMYLPRQSTSALFASLSLVATGASKPWPTFIFFFDERSKIPMKMLMTGLTCFETIFTTKTCGVFYIVLLTGSRSTLYPTIMVWSWPEGSIPAVA